jgi:hypothetical protein
MSPGPKSDEEAWQEVLATVTACRYDAGAGRALAFGMPTAKHFRISYNYFAGDELHTGEFRSAKAIPQGTLFPIRYNPDAPRQTSHDASGSARGVRGMLIAIGIFGSCILSLLWFALMRGCR